MSDWQDAWYIFRSEMRQSWMGVLFTLLFFSYFGLITMPNFIEMMVQEDPNTDIGWITDFLYLTITPIMSFLMNRSIYRCRTDDPFTKRLAYYKTMPISLNAIVIARMLQMFAVLITVGTFFYSLQYALADRLRELLSIEQYLIFVFIWIGYSITIGCVYIYFEQAHSGRVYFNISLLFFVPYIILGILLWVYRPGILFHLILVAKNMEIIWPILMNVFAVGVVAVTAVMVRRRLAARDFQH